MLKAVVSIRLEMMIYVLVCNEIRTPVVVAVVIALAVVC